MLQGTTGKELVALTDELLQSIDISNPLHRLQLLNRRDELMAQKCSSLSPKSQAGKELSTRIKASSRLQQIWTHATVN